MARLVLITQDEVLFEIRPNEMETLEMVATPVMDQSGMEVLYHKVRIDVRAVINPLMLATNQPANPLNPPAPPGALPSEFLNYAAGPGDRAGLTARAIMQLMGNPRPLVQYWIGPDLCLEAPERLDLAGNNYPPCDPMGGPFVRHCRAYEMRGDKTIFLNLSLELATTAYKKVLLTNRWRMTADIDSAGYTTRTTEGVATFRLDGLDEIEFLPDDFRSVLLIPADSTLRRTHANFTAEDDNQTYRYRIVDRETSYGMGATSGVEKIDGTVTLHMGTQALTAKNLTTGGIDAVGSLARGTDWLSLLWGGVRKVINVTTVDIRMSCAVRVQGQNGASMATLYNIGMKVYSAKVLAALAASGYRFALESILVTQWIGSEDQPIIEIRASGIAVALVSFTAMYSGSTLAQFMNLLTGIPAPVNYLPSTPRTQYPSSNNTRGQYLGNLFAQALTTDSSDLPPAPAAAPIAFDVAAV